MSGPRSLARFWGAIPIALIVILLALRGCLTTHPLENLARSDANPRDPQGTVAYTGSLHIARGGPVIVGFQSDRPARLLVGSSDPTQQIAKDLVGKGLVKERIVLPAGTVAIRFAASPGARLVWSPVGRRGDPEYVPPSSLSPEPPERAEFGRWAGARPLDGVIAAAILLVLIGTCLMLVRERLRKVPRTIWIAIGSVFLLGCLVRWVGLSDFGQTWDEDVNWSAGRNYVTNLLALDASPGSWIWNYEHPPVMKYLAGIGAQFADGFGPARALSAIWMSLGCALLVPIGTRLYNVRAGVLAGLVATLLPHLIGHGQIVGHEAPTVLWWTLGILLALTARDGEPTARQRQVRFIAVGVVIGIAVASRFVSGLLGPLLVAIVVLESPAERRIRTFFEAGILMPIAAVIAFVALWPRLWFTPIASLEASLGKLSQTHSTEPFLGTLTNTPGASYFVAYLAATLPIMVLAGVGGWLARAGRERTRGSWILLLWLVVPLAVMASPVRQDGIRYVMPSVLALALMSAAGWEWSATLTQRWIPRAFLAWSALLVIYLGATALRVRPYYIDYYGEHVGGPANVASEGLFETAWWGEGVAEAVDHVNAHAAPGARVSRNCIEPAHLAWFREDLWAPMTNQPAQADWIVAYSPSTRPCAIPSGFKVDHVVRVQSAVLAIVYKR
jgi:4-amino-4-deoxy-L-arabinose transferase-like glycosyltransferase